jgi:hypothetical protein
VYARTNFAALDDMEQFGSHVRSYWCVLYGRLSKISSLHMLRSFRFVYFQHFAYMVTGLTWRLSYVIKRKIYKHNKILKCKQRFLTFPVFSEKMSSAVAFPQSINEPIQSEQ